MILVNEAGQFHHLGNSKKYSPFSDMVPTLISSLPSCTHINCQICLFQNSTVSRKNDGHEGTLAIASLVANLRLLRQNL